MSKPSPERYLGPAGRQQAARDATLRLEQLARRAFAKRATVKRIKPVSRRRAAALKLYAVAKGKHLKAHPCCQKCGYKKEVAIHHQRGRVGDLLHDARYFVTLCRLCHLWVHAFPKQAQEMGYLAGAGKWNENK